MVELEKRGFRLCVRLCRACSSKPVFRTKSQRVRRGWLRSNRDCRNGSSPTFGNFRIIAYGHRCSG